MQFAKQMHMHYCLQLNDVQLTDQPALDNQHWSTSTDQPALFNQHWSTSTDVLPVKQKLIWKMYLFKTFETDVAFYIKTDIVWVWRWKIDGAINCVLKHKAAVQKKSVSIPARTENSRYCEVL
jgi:hypothetical protein